MREVELKFDIAPRDIGALQRALGTASGRKPMLALYFDTREEQLRQSGMALRLRREGERWVQALKGAGHAAGGLHARDEYEFESAGRTLDLTPFRDSPLAALPGAQTLHERLAIAFEVRLERTTWQVEPAPGVVLEVAFDRGKVSRGSATDTVCEVEIESKAGPDGAVFDFARTLLDRVPLVPSGVTKAQRGYRLARSEVPQPVQARPVDLHTRMSAGEGARSILGACLAAVIANMEGVLAGDEPEFVHQLRVSLRRTRSALRVFRRILGKQLVDEMREPLREASRLAGRVRDLHVFAMQTLPAIRQANAAAAPGTHRDALLSAERRRARRALVSGLRSPGFARALLALAQVVHATPAPGGKSLKRVAASRLRKMERALLRTGAALADMDDTARHRLRVRAKRLRYALESCATLFPHKAAKRHAALLSALQDALGDANDMRIARGLLRETERRSRGTPVANAWLDGTEADAVRRAAPLLQELRRARAPWSKH